MYKFSNKDLDQARSRYYLYLESSCRSVTEYSLSSKSDTSAFARCFAIFGYKLLKINIDYVAETLAIAIVKDIDDYREKRGFLKVDLKFDKPYLQLLTFSLSALSSMNMLAAHPLTSHINPLISKDVLVDLECCGALRGEPSSGNQAMFIAIFLIHAKRLGINDFDQLAKWQSIHRENFNQFGFLGKSTSMTHLQFQNGYHQYEIFEYLNSPDLAWQQIADNVAMLSDSEGHFAPYPGGGACYDYDAIFFLTSNNKSILKHSQLLAKIASTILDSQNEDGGFCESKHIRPRSIANVKRFLKHIHTGKGMARAERLYQMLTLMRPKHDRIHTHWSNYSRKWDESDLWDSWFRMLAIARIDIALNPGNAGNWGFIDYPGVGFHPSIRG